jgi:hypothetical protein
MFEKVPPEEESHNTFVRRMEGQFSGPQNTAAGHWVGQPCCNWLTLTLLSTVTVTEIIYGWVIWKYNYIYGSGKRWPWPVSNYYLSIHLDRLREAPVMITGILVEIWTGYQFRALSSRRLEYKPVLRQVIRTAVSLGEAGCYGDLKRNLQRSNSHKNFI